MGERTVLAVLSAAQVLQFAAAVFFHEPSSILIRPHTTDETEDYSDFGFAMGYRSAIDSLVVGAPRADHLGKVYTCELENAGYLKEISCDENLIDFDTLAPYSRKINPNQYFYTGSSIAATSDYLFTCAPLWTLDVTKASGQIMSDAFGTCFMHNDTNSYRYQGTLERYLKPRSKISNLKSFIGGTGWSTLLDEDNDLLLIVKTSLDGDFIFTSMSDPLKETKSLVLMTGKASRRSAMYLQKHWNIGYGITAGKFFSNKTVYAFSMQLKNMGGAISFLEYNSKRNVLSIMYRGQIPYKLNSNAIGTMFGSTMGAADLNMDGKDELLVGAPAQSEEDCVECGALHIYMGGDVETMEDRNRLRTILGVADFGRFGTAIAAEDIDGDSIPELVVSAPYEDEGLGAIYILSGYELYHTVVKFRTFKRILVSDLKLTQKIQKEPYKTLGFSLQFVSDTDENGCNELAAGSPGNSSVALFRCIQTINVTVFSELIGEQIVREQDENFTIAVCARVETHKLPRAMVGNLSIVSSIIGDAAYIPKPEFLIDISCDNCTTTRLFCENVTVILTDKDPRDYTFTSRAELHTDHIFESEDFNSTWVVDGPYSKLVKSIEVPRHCSGNDCIPKLSVKALWSGSKEYVLGSSTNETATIRVRNDGNASYEACVWVRVSGAPLTRVGCAADNGGYKCYLPKPLRRDSEYSIKLMLNMTRPTNVEKGLLVEVLLYENCNQKSIASDKIQIPYVFATNDIYANGISHTRNITDKQIMNSDSIFDGQEYLITNNGSITWKNVYAIISMEKKPFIHSVKVTATDSGKCKDINVAGTITYNCTLDIMANATQKITATTEILGSDIKANLYDEKLNTTSQLKLYLQPTGEIKAANVITVLKFEKDLSFGSNKLLIALLALLVAIIILAIVIFILYKKGFFRRKQKQRLHVLKESIKRKNSRRATHTSDTKDGVENVEGLQMDVDDDCPFDEIPIPDTTKDNVGLVEEKK